MATKMIVLALCVVSTLGGAIPEAARYPAGVDPSVCPNYPNCDNVALAARMSSPYAAPAYSAYGHQSGVPGAAASYPAGVDSRVCPNYPYCGPTPAQGPASGYNSWSAPAPQNSWSAPAPQNSWANSAPQNTYSNPSSQNFWSNPSAPQLLNYAHSQNFQNTPSPSSNQQGGAIFPAGVDPSFCPNYPYCH